MAKLKDRLADAAERVWKAYLKFGPVDDGRPEGEEFEAALLALRTAQKKFRLQTTDERAALIHIINTINGNPEPCHFKIREAIEAARKVTDYSEIFCEDEDA